MLLRLNFLSLLIPRKTQIFAAEAIAPLVALLLMPELLRGPDVIWFVDNEAAVSSLIRGSSKSEDVGHLAAAVHVTCLELGVRIWYEWIDSKSNPADGLSRAGLSDQWTREQSWHLHEVGPEMMDRIAEYVRSPTLARLIGPLADVFHTGGVN